MNNTAPTSRSVTSERIVTNSSNYRPPCRLFAEIVVDWPVSNMGTYHSVLIVQAGLASGCRRGSGSRGPDAISLSGGTWRGARGVSPPGSPAMRWSASVTLPGRPIGINVEDRLSEVTHQMLVLVGRHDHTCAVRASQDTAAGCRTHTGAGDPSSLRFTARGGSSCTSAARSWRLALERMTADLTDDKLGGVTGSVVVPTTPSRRALPYAAARRQGSSAIRS
jgi:hypothetical protein